MFHPNVSFFVFQNPNSSASNTQLFQKTFYWKNSWNNWWKKVLSEWYTFEGISYMTYFLTMYNPPIGVIVFLIFRISEAGCRSGSGRNSRCCLFFALSNVGSCLHLLSQLAALGPFHFFSGGWLILWKGGQSVNVLPVGGCKFRSGTWVLCSCFFSTSWRRSRVTWPGFLQYRHKNLNCSVYLWTIMWRCGCHCGRHWLFAIVFQGAEFYFTSQKGHNLVIWATL